MRRSTAAMVGAQHEHPAVPWLDRVPARSALRGSVSTPPGWGMPYWLAALAAVLGVVLAVRRAEHRPVALFLVAMVAIDLGRLYLRGAFHLDVPGPYVGAQRVAFHAEEAGFLTWPAGLAALALNVFGGQRRPWP